jgi:CelD/BcsL family acetyltransferase involved in cellulose biosynthesis
MSRAVPPPTATPRDRAFHLGEDWWACWQAAYGERMRAIAGVRVVPARTGPLRTLRAATNPHSVCYDAAPDAPVADLPARLFAQTRAACVRFDYLAEEARLLAAAATWRTRYRVRVAPHAQAPVADCRRGHADWLAARSKRIRQLLRRSHKALVEQRGMRMTLTTDDPTEGGLLDAMLRLEASGWKGRDGTAIRDSAADTRFYTELARAAARAGVLRIASLWDGERLAAFEYGVLGGDRLFLLKVGYDEAHADYAPGHLLAAWHIAQCCADPAVSWYDKMGNGMTPAPYKLRFADACATRWQVTVYAPGVAGRLAALADEARARVKGARQVWRARRRGDDA